MVSYADTGAKTILVKVRDNKSIESTIDTIHLSVFEKLYTVSYDGNGSTGGSVPLDNNAYGQDRASKFWKTWVLFSRPGIPSSVGIPRQMTAAQGTCRARILPW